MEAPSNGGFPFCLYCAFPFHVVATVIKAVLFDFDGVLTTDTSGSQTTVRRLAQEFGASEQTVWEALCPFNDDLLLGRTTHSAVWPAVCSALGVSLDIGALERAFASTPINEPMVRLAKALRAGGSRLGVVTDNKADRIDYLVAHWGLADLFDCIAVSAKVGSDKGNGKIFWHALRALAVAPGEALFIDNSQRNVEAARALGIHAVLHCDERNDVPALSRRLWREYGLPV